ncbi:MAG: glycoside hydrolase family 3 C-terminal domain-containing protein [Oscillospiraceae bacterium]|nr:glycoside hydrolase family 3 C-terminal domain-containing protein [Oscillospiraceae bacterium]
MNLNTWNNETLRPEQRAQALLDELSLDEKLSQINSVFSLNEKYLDFDWIASQTPVGIGEVSTLELRRIETLIDAAAWQRRVQEIVMANSPHRIPAIFHMEGLCGAMVQEGISLPAGIARGASFDPALEERLARAVARQESAVGIGHILAPVLDVTRDPRMGRQGESYGEDPCLAAVLGAAYVRGAQSTETDGLHPACVAKHFLAFHNSQGGIHGSHSDTPPRLLREVYAKPFQAAIQAGLRGVMPCYCSLDGEPASVSKTLLTGLLRKELGFEGLTVSDYGGIHNAHETDRIGETLGEAGAMALEAGMDVEMPSPSGYGEELKAMIEHGEVDMKLVDRAVLRVLTEKFRMGLFEHPFALQDEVLHVAFGRAEDRELSLQSARESLVLLKNDGALPLKKTIRRLVVIGPHADAPRMLFGGYTFMSMAESTLAARNSIAGVEGAADSCIAMRLISGTSVQSDEGEEFDAILRRQKPGCRSLLQELRERMSDTEIVFSPGYPVAGADQSGFADALRLCESADAILLTLGGKHGTCSLATMGEGVDATSINLPPCQDAFIRAAAKLGKSLIGVHFDGRPISSDAADECLNAILECWSPAECGAQAVADVLLGELNPGGRLPVSVAYHAGQIPVYYNHPHGSAWHQAESIGFPDYVDCPHLPRYPFGFGLSYTSFAYSDLLFSKSELAPDEELIISVRLANIGERAGDEVVQLYVSDRFASRTRPVQELAGFCRVHLNAGEAKTVRFTLRPSQLAFLDGEMKWKIEKGAFDFRIGASSEDSRLSGSFTVTRDAWIDGKTRAMTAQTEVEP